MTPSGAAGSSPVVNKQSGSTTKKTRGARDESIGGGGNATKSPRSSSRAPAVAGANPVIRKKTIGGIDRQENVNTSQKVQVPLQQVHVGLHFVNHELVDQQHQMVRNLQR